MSPNSLVFHAGKASWSRIALALGACLAMGLPAAADPALQDGLIAYWAFDDASGSTSVVDAINANNAAIVGGTWTTGKLAGGMYFNGLSDGADVASSESLNPTTSALTISTWVQANQYPSLLSTAYGAIYDSRQDSYIVYQDRGNKELRFKVATMNDAGTASGASRVGVNEAWLDTGWHHVVGVYDGGSGRIYYDGKLVDQSGISGTAGRVLANQVAGFGCQPPAGTTIRSDFFDGTIDDTAIWNRALSEAEITYLYNGGTGLAVTATNPTLAPDPISIPDPVLHYKFDGNLTNSGTLGSAYDGRLAGTTGTATYVDAKDGQGIDFAQVSKTVLGGVHVEVDYVLPEKGTIVFWAKPHEFYNYNALLDNSAGADYWEMWVPTDGNASFRTGGSDGKALYDLDNLEGADQWYQFAVSWFREEVPEGLESMAVSVGSSMFINGVHVGGSDGTKGWVTPGATFAIGGGLLNPAGIVTIDDFQLYDECLSTAEILSLTRQEEESHPGDANRDGKVDDLDASILAANWQRSGDATWETADFNADGDVNDLDASILAANWQYGVGSAVPEPGTLALLLTAALALLAWRRR